MGLERCLLSIFMISFCYYSCYSNQMEGPPTICVHEASPYDIQAYPTYFGAINGEDGECGPGFWTKSSNLDGDDAAADDDDDADVPESSSRVVNVDDFGAKGDGTDDTEAFEKAWKEACSSAPSILVVPKNKSYLLKPITFSGPCKSSIKVMIYGTIQASTNRSDWNGSKQRRHWLRFQKINKLLVEGGGTIDGNGEIWWNHSCKIDKSQPCKDAPTALIFYSCKNFTVKDLMFKDSQQIHLSFERCSHVKASNLVVTAPEKSPNTDGIHVTGTLDIQIDSCVIGTGDDCISIVSGSQNVEATNITCGPGHGISIGSLGKGSKEAHVSQVLVDGAKLVGTTNGVRIKTWQGGSGNVNNIQFQNIVMDNVERPIIIDQNYCDSKKPCPKQESAVEISNVVYKNIKGTSASEVAVKFDCSESFPCNGIVLENIDLEGMEGISTTSSCKNVEGLSKGTVYPPFCF